MLPIDVAIYILCLEEVIIRINNNSEIKGYKINNGVDKLEIKILAYADDTTCLVIDLISIEKIIEEFNEWGKLSGANLNLLKTEILQINETIHFNDNIKMVDDIKILGIIFNKIGIDNKNYTRVKEKQRILEILQ